MDKSALLKQMTRVRVKVSYITNDLNGVIEDWAVKLMCVVDSGCLISHTSPDPHKWGSCVQCNPNVICGS